MIGQTVSHYRILEKIGQGGMGEVFLAEDTKLERRVALKFLPAQFSADEEERKRFVHEAKAASALDHPNICSVYEIGETPDGQLFIAMGYYEGKTLKDIISVGARRAVPLPINDVINITLQIAEGLQEAHRKGIVHRDLKPANIMLTEQGQAKIVDFGLAKLRGLTRLTKSGTTLGTVAYMSPEQALGKEVDQRSDIWSLGVILYEMLAGKLPFPGEYDQAMLYAVINEEPESLSKLRSDVPDELQSIVRKALAKKPVQRYAQAEEMLADLRALGKAVPSRPGKLLRILRKPTVAVPGILVLAAIAFFSLRFFKRQAKVRWAKNELLPKISQLAESRLTLDNPGWQTLDYQSMLAYIKISELAIRAKKSIPDDPQLAKIFSSFSTRLEIRTDPPGAKVYIKYYQEPDNEWRYLGESPLDIQSMPIAFLRVKMEKEGYEPVMAGAVSWGEYDSKAGKRLPGKIYQTLDKKGTIPTDMARVTGGEVKGIGKLEDFYMDRFEVTNKQYREFIQKGGYQKKEYWKNAFVKEGKPLTWEQAMADFVDKTDLAGPAAWQAGDYPEGEDDYPVSGISWYEAAAFAEYAGKTLSGGYHWGVASGELTPMNLNLSFYEFIIPQSNFKGKGPERVGSNPGITTYGLYDMAGNVREWCSNETPNGRLIRGGAADDAAYMFVNCSQLSPFDRSLKNGFRCCRYIHPEKVPKAALAIDQIMEFPDFYKQKPVSDKIFQVYKEQYAYDKVDLGSQLEARDDTAKEWVVEKVSFAAAYESERVPAFLYLPKNSSPPFQTIIYFPGGDAQLYRSSKSIENSLSYFAFIPMVKNGRAVMFPVYKGTYERRSAALDAILISGTNTHQYTEFFIKVVKDLRRSIDYLETRSDIDSKKLAYSGFSWGGHYGAIIPAIEERLKLSILNAGRMWGDARPEVNEINYVSRVKIPTLMLNGRYDLPLTFKPMFDLLGTPAANKRLVLYETDHIIPLNECIKESSKWLDRYFGPVKPRPR